MKRFTIGLATTFHEPALAILGPDGDVLFAESAERYLQFKRAPNCEPDLPGRMVELAREYLEPDAEVVVATSWGAQFSEFLDRSASAGAFAFERLASLSSKLTRSMVPEIAERTFIASLHIGQKRAGLGVLLGLHRAFGKANVKLRRYGHHLTHAAYGSLASPFDEALCLVVDGMGETGASGIYAYENGRVSELVRHRGRESVGFYFGLVTDLCGFDQSKGEEWKVMGLAPYGQRDPGLLDQLHRLYKVENGKLAFADEATIRDAVEKILARRPGEVKEGWADLARCGQDVFEEMMTVLLAETATKSGSKNLVLAGGCALNSSFNGKILNGGRFQSLFVPSAPADDGNAIGAAWLAHGEDFPDWRAPKGPISPYLGSRVSTKDLDRISGWEPRLKRLGERIVPETARLLAEGKLVGWVQGRAEFGPRALGNRSILADPRPANAKDLINAKVKLREPFRPFAPAILAEHGPEWFEDYQPSPYMERTLLFREGKRALVPAVVHTDGTGRLQSVTQEANPRFRTLLEEFHKLSGVPLLLNTSFNVMGKPILHSVDDALMMFYTTGLDAVVIEDWLITK
jgi:carbamoyltransferase